MVRRTHHRATKAGTRSRRRPPVGTPSAPVILAGARGDAAASVHASAPATRDGVVVEIGLQARRDCGELWLLQRERFLPSLQDPAQDQPRRLAPPSPASVPRAAKNIITDRKSTRLNSSHGY